MLILGNRKKILGYSAAVILILLFTLLTAGCGGPEKEETAAPEKPRPVIRIGLIPEQNIFRQLERYEPVAKYVSEKIGADIKLKVLTRYGNVIDNFVAARIDGAFFGSFVYTRAHLRLGIESLVRPELVNGVSTYHGIIIVRKDSGIKNLSDMKGRRFAFVDQETSAGYLFPLKYFIERGVPDYQNYFQELYFAGTHEDVIYDVLHKKADVGAAKNTIYEQIVQDTPEIKDKLVILASSPNFPENCLAVSRNLDSVLKRKLKDTMMNMHKDPEGILALHDFGAKKFIDTKDSDYRIVYQYAKVINRNCQSQKK